MRDDRVDRYLPGPDVTTEAALHDRIDRLACGAPAGERWLNFAVLREGTVIGRLEATVYDAWAEIAYVLGPAYWGHGYASAAVAWLVGEVGVAEIWAAVHADNARSIAVLERTGFTRRAAPARPLGSYDPGDVVYALVMRREPAVGEP